MSYKAVIKVGGEPVGVIFRDNKKDEEREIEWFKKACKDVWPGEVVTIKRFYRHKENE